MSNTDGREFGIAISDSSTVFAYLSSEHKRKDSVGIVMVEKVSQKRQVLATPHLRRLVLEMYSVFDRLQKESAPDTVLDTATSCTYSTAYRSILYNAAVSHNNQEFMTDFAMWSLYEKLWFTRGDSSICGDLISWATQSFNFVKGAVETSAELVEDGTQVPEEYWRGVAVSLLSCHFQDCAQLLSLLDRNSEIEAFIEVLNSFDHQNLSDEASVDKINEWRDHMRDNLERNAYQNSPNITFLAKLLLGEQNYFQTAPRFFDSWWQFLPFYVLAKNPFATHTELVQLASECRLYFTDEPEDRDVFWCLVAKDDNNFQQLIVSNPWLAVHLVDLIHKSTLDPEFEEMRRTHMLDYGNSLITNSPLWEIGAGYLIACGTVGLLHLETQIEGLHIEDDEMAEQLLELSEMNRLEDAKSCVTNTMTIRYLTRNEWSAALAWALKTGSKKMIDMTVSRIVSSSSKKELAVLRVLNSISSGSVLRLPSLTFLYSYQRFVKMMHSGDVLDCVQHLIPLIMMPDVPTQYYYDLFDYLITIIKEDGRSGIHISKEILNELSTFLSTFTYDKHRDLNSGYIKKVTVLKKMVMLKMSDSIARGIGCN